MTMHCNAFAANGIGREVDDGSAQRGRSVIYNCLIIIIIIADEYDLGGTVALLLQDHLTLLIVSHVTTNQSTTA